MTNYNDGKWHGWNGGECPVHPRTVVEIITTYPGTGEDRAEGFCWNKPDFYGEKIVAFRVVKEYREPREWWIGSDGKVYAEESLSPAPRIHVVERLT